MTKKLQLTLLYVLAAVLLAALAFGVSFPALAEDAATEPVEIVTLSDAADFNIDETGKCTGLSDAGGDKVSDDWLWEGTFNRYFELIFPANVTSVQTADFIENDKLVKVSFAEGSLCSSMKRSGRFSNLFSNNTALKEVDFTNAVNLTAIGSGMFNGCTSLEKVTFADSLTDNAEMTISSSAFAKTAFTSFEIPSYVTSIASNTFSECTKLTTMTVAEGNAKYTYYTKENGERYDQAVYEKDADGNIVALAVAPATMTSIYVPKAVLDVTYVPEEGEDEATTAANIAAAVTDKAVALDSVLSSISALETIEMEENDELYAYGNCLFVKEGSKLTSEALEYPILANDLLTVPYAVKEITLPVGFIYKPADGNSYDQESYFWYYYLDSMATNVGGYVPMRQLEAIKVDADNAVYRSIDGSLFPKENVSEFWVAYAATSFTVPAEMTADLSALSAKLADNKLVKEIKVEEGNAVYTSIGGSLFKKDYSDYYMPSAATSFTVPAEMTTLDFSALSANENLQEITVEEGNAVFTSFEGVLFKNDGSEFWIPSGTTTLTIPASITSISLSALANNSGLREVKVAEGHPSYISEDGIIYNKEKTELLFINQNVDVTEFYVPATLQKISENAFAVYDGDKRVANRVKKVYVEDVEAWSRIKFGDPIETAEQYEADPVGRSSQARRRAAITGLKSGYGANPMSCGADMYVKNNGRWELLEHLSLDFDGQISDLAFAGCKSLRTVTIGNKVTRIGEMAFAMCKNIRSISVPFVGCTREYIEVNEQYGFYSVYAWEVFGGRGAGESGSAMFELAPDTIDTYTVTGCNILTETIHKEGSIDIDQHTGYPINIIPRYAFNDLPVRKIVIDIAELVEGGVTLGTHALLRSTVSEIDLENSQITVSKGALIAHQNDTSSVASFIKSITVPKTLTNIPSLFFWVQNVNSSLEKVIIPEGVEYLNWNQFGDIDTLTLPSTIGGFDSLEGVKTVYLTGFTAREGQKINTYLARTTGIYVAIDSDVYAMLPDTVKGDEQSEDYAPNKIFYQADVVFRLKDSTGKVLAETTEKHLAAAGANSKTYLKWNQTQGAGGDVYWALNDSYALPDTIGHYKADSTKWTLDGVQVTSDTCLKGDKAQYVIEQTLDSTAILLTPKDEVKMYDGTEWTVPAGMEITKVSAMKGGNNYTYGWSSKTMPVDAGTYSVTAKCVAGYSWYDSASVTSTERTFTLQITPTSADVKWFYSPDGAAWQNVTGTVPEHVYDGQFVHSRFYAEFTDVLGQTRRVDYTNLSLYVSGDRSSPVYSLIDVGSYDVTVNDSGKSTDNVAWLGNYSFADYLQFGITPRVIDLNDYANLSWGLENYSSTLRDGNVYIYKGVPYAYEQPALGSPDRTLYVLDSIVRLRNADNHKIVISNVPALLAGGGMQYTAEYGGNTATATGIFNATARLTVANGNYVFGYGLGSDLKSRGMTITINPDGTATVTKVWYVVAIDNGMLKTDGTEYAINGWTFGDNVSVTAPRLEHGDENDGYLNNNNVHFTLTRNGETIASNFARSVFSNYINKSMPAGRYELVCVVSDVTVGSHTHWWNNEEHGSADADVLYHGFTRTLVFEVKAANMTFTLPVNGDNGYAAYEWELNASKEGFFAKFESAVNAAGKVVLTSVVPQGYWADHRSEYYGNYSLTYNFARMSNNTYLKADDGNIHKYIEGGAKGTYTVYFQISAPNHNPLTGMGDGRYAYFFTVTVFEKVATPVVSDNGLVYTGSRVIPEIAENELYEVIWDADDAYVAGGKHSVSFRLYDSVHYRWKDISLDTVSVDFTIGKANNAWVRVPNIVNWTYDTFDTQVNRIRAVVKFLDEGQSIKFSIVRSDDSAVAGLTDFEVKADGTVDNQTLIAALNGLKVGAYKLKVTVASTDNYGALEQYVDFTIGKSINTWADGEDDLVLPSWIVGTFNPEENLIVVKAAHGEAIIEIRDMDGNVYYNSTKPEENTLNTLDVGKYLLVAWVAESEDYAALAERSFTIEVLEKIGLPWWGTTLIAVGALAVAAAIILILWKLKVFEILTDKISLAITTRATVDATIAAVRATKKAEEADAHKRKVEARERLEAAREANKNKTPEQRAEELAAKAEVTATKADKLHARASKMRERADKLAGKTEQNSDVTDDVTVNPDDTSTEE